MDVTKAIRSLAAQVSAAKDERVLHLLLRLRETLHNSRLDSRERKSAFHLVWKSDLIHVMVGVMRKDFSRLPGGWDTAAQLAELLATICSDLKPREFPQKQLHARKKKGAETESKDFYDKLLPTAVDSLLILANSLLEHTMTSTAPKSRVQCRSSTLQTFQSVLVSLSQLCSSHKECACKTLQSPYILSMITTSQPQYCLAVVTTLNHLMKTGQQLFVSAIKSHSQTILDVLAYKITSSDEVELQAECVKLLAVFIDPTCSSDVLYTLCSKYTTLASVVFKFKNYGLGENVELLVETLESQSPVTERLAAEVPPLGVDETAGDSDLEGIEPQASHDRSETIATSVRTTADQSKPVTTVHAATAHHSAAVFQASCKGYADKQQLKTTEERIEYFQPEYQEMKAEQKGFRMCEKDVAVTKQLQSLSEMRTFHEKQMSLLEQLPAGEVASFLRNQQTSAATRIQSWWRGRLDRERCKEKRERAQLVAAVVVVQRAVRRFLKGKQKPRHLQPTISVVEGQERDRLQREIVQYREEHPPLHYSEARLKQTHDEVQHLLGEFYSRLPTETREAERRELFLSKLEQDCGLLLGAPGLSEVRGEQIERFSSGSRAVAMMAQQAHREEMRATELPWWKLAVSDSHDKLLELLN